MQQVGVGRPASWGGAQPLTRSLAHLFNRERLGLAGLLGATALLYLWALGASGWANSFYSAAVQADTKNWVAFLFGSFDASNFITVDKPPASLWVMDLSVKLFGLNSWSILVPQALEGVATVALLFLTVRRVFGSAAGFIAGAALAATPVAALMFRYNNPDALLVLLLVGAAYALVRALDGGHSTRWLLLAGALVGTGFITKMLQAFLVLPAMVLVYLALGPPGLWRRTLQLLAALGSLLVFGGWWVALVQLWPASARPYIGGSQNNSELNLIFGYNGFGRLTGNETGSVGASGPGGWGPTGLDRLFLPSFGGDISWLIPAALVGAAALLWLTWRAPRRDPVRASALLWLGWLLVTGLTFSLAQGIIHPYYTVALAPAIAALVGGGAVLLWRVREQLLPRLLLAAAVLLTSIWSWVLLERVPGWLPWLAPLVLVLGVAACLGLLGVTLLPRRLAAAVAGLALAACLVGTGAYTIATAAQAHTGAIPPAGPAQAASLGNSSGGPGPGTGFRRRFGGGFPGQRGSGHGGFPGFGSGGFPGFGGGSTGSSGTRSPGFGSGGFPGFGGGTGAGQGGFPGFRGGGPGGGGSGLGGLINSGTPSAALTAALRQDAGDYRWVLAVVGADNAAGYQLASGDPVMAIGGFNGTDPAPTLAQFQAMVSRGEIHYFIASGLGGGGGDASRITSWVEEHFSATTIGGARVYVLASR